MEILDAFNLARLQFAFTVSFHIIFPLIGLGFASFFAVLERRWLKTEVIVSVPTRSYGDCGPYHLGIGLLFLFFESKSERQVMLHTIEPVWDGSETFPVLGAA